MKPTYIFSFLLLLLPCVKSQQGYEVNNAQLNCSASSSSSTVLGYTCNSLPSCPSFLSFRSQPPSLLNSLTPSSSPSSAQFAVNDLIIRPNSCSCFKSLYYPHNATYRIIIRTTGETYQGLSVCQALIAGDEVTLPIRCVCPTRQPRSGEDHLPFRDPLDSAEQGAEQGSGSGPAAAARSESGDGGGSGRKWVFVGIGIGAGFVVLCGVLGWYYFCCFRVRGRQPLGNRQTNKAGDPTPNDHGALSGKASTDPFMSSEIRGFVEALVVYRFSDLEKAAEFFAEDHRIRGSVYRAVINGDDAAIKRLNGDVSNEIKILKRINHSNVVRLSGFCVHEGNTYLVYEFAQNGALSDWLHHEKDSVDRVLNWKQRVRVAYDVADGLNYLHNYTDPPYIHKNLKSSNILLDSEFRAKLGNFGLARAVEEEENGPQLTRHVVGTQGYMAPEYLEHGLITPKLDVFAFGVIILELLSGKEAIFAKDGDDKGEVLLWAWIGEVMKGENVRSRVRDFIDPCLGNEYPFDLAFAMAEVALRCVVVEPGSRPAMAEVLMSLSAIYNSTLDWDPSDV